MSPSLAIFLSVLFIGWSWYRDHKRHPELSHALWVPVIWLLILGSRPLSFWLGVGGSGDRTEGNAFDRNFYLILIFISWMILRKRGVDWNRLLRNNWFIALLYAYLLVTVLWSPYPGASFKRWFKDIAAILVMLVMFTEKNPIEAMKAVFFRCAYVLLPLSVVFIKYVPELGRSYARSGGVMYGGVTPQKNTLGELVLVVCLVLVWHLAGKAKTLREIISRENRIGLFLLLIGFWLLHISQSKTALICLLVGMTIVTSHLLPFFKTKPRHLITFLIIAIPAGAALEYFFDVSKIALALLNRAPTLTGRTEIWELLKQYPVHPIFGIGYLAFWDAHSEIEIQTEWGMQVIRLLTAHNGYIEIHLDGGAIAVALLLLMLIISLQRLSAAFCTGSSFARLQFAFFIVMLLYNFSESMFFRRSLLWFTYLLFCGFWPLCAFAIHAARVTEIDEFSNRSEAPGKENQEPPREEDWTFPTAHPSVR